MKVAADQSQVSLDVSDFPLAMFRRLVARFSPTTTFAGRLSSNVRLSWGGQSAATAARASSPWSAADYRMEGNLRLDDFALATPALQPDVFRLDHCQAACQASYQTDRAVIEKASIDCDFGELAVSGTVPLGGKDGFSIAALLRQRQDLKAGLDLARLARALPATLHLRPNVRLDSGRVELALGSTSGPQGAVWHGQLEVANLAATAGSTGFQPAAAADPRGNSSPGGSRSRLCSMPTMRPADRSSTGFNATPIF